MLHGIVVEFLFRFFSGQRFPLVVIEMGVLWQSQRCWHWGVNIQDVVVRGKGGHVCIPQLFGGREDPIRV
jgi:hypothetical protein